MYAGFSVPLAATVAMEWTPTGRHLVVQSLAADNIPPHPTAVNPRIQLAADLLRPRAEGFSLQ